MKRRSVFFAVLPIVVLMLFSACASPEKPFSSDKSYEQAAAGYTFADGLSETDLPARPARSEVFPNLYMRRIISRFTA